MDFDEERLTKRDSSHTEVGWVEVYGAVSFAQLFPPASPQGFPPSRTPASLPLSSRHARQHQKKRYGQFFPRPPQCIG